METKFGGNPLVSHSSCPFIPDATLLNSMERSKDNLMLGMEMQHRKQMGETRLLSSV